MKSMLGRCVFALLLLGCQKSEDKQNTALIESTAPPAAASPVAASVVTVATNDVSAISVPVEEDFEQKAEVTVNASTANQELDKLEKEIGQ